MPKEIIMPPSPSQIELYRGITPFLPCQPAKPVASTHDENRCVLHINHSALTQDVTGPLIKANRDHFQFSLSLGECNLTHLKYRSTRVADKVACTYPDLQWLPLVRKNPPKTKGRKKMHQWRSARVTLFTQAALRILLDLAEGGEDLTRDRAGLTPRAPTHSFLPARSL